MRRFIPLILAVLTGAALPVLAVSESAPDDADHNRRLLDQYRADPDHYARLVRDLRAFQDLSPEKQERMRQIDRYVHDEDPALQEVLERYTDWVNRLSETEQKRIEQAADRTERLAVVKELRQKEWIERLPKKDHDELLMLPEAERPARLAALRQKERQLRQGWVDWANALKAHPDAGPNPRPSHPTRLTDFPPEVQQYVNDQLTPTLGEDEKKQLSKASDEKWPTLALTILGLSEKHPVKGASLPGPHELWASARLPDVSWRTLNDFAKNELTPEERANLHLRGADQAERYDKLKLEYFKRHPNKVEAWRRWEQRQRK